MIIRLKFKPKRNLIDLPGFKLMTFDLSVRDDNHWAICNGHYNLKLNYKNQTNYLN